MHSDEGVVLDYTYMNEDELWEFFRSSIGKGKMLKDAEQMLENLGGSFAHGVFLIMSTTLLCLERSQEFTIGQKAIEYVVGDIYEVEEVLQVSETLVKINDNWQDIDIDIAGLSVVDYDRAPDEPEVDYSRRQMAVMDALVHFVTCLMEHLEIDRMKPFRTKIAFALLDDGIMSITCDR